MLLGYELAEQKSMMGEAGVRDSGVREDAGIRLPWLFA